MSKGLSSRGLEIAQDDLRSATFQLHNNGVLLTHSFLMVGVVAFVSVLVSILVFQDRVSLRNSSGCPGNHSVD